MAVLAERLLLLGVSGWLLVWLWQRGVWQWQQHKLETVFYDLLSRQNGKITLIQLAAKSQIDPEIVQSFLREKARFFGAVIDSDIHGHEYYQFPPL